MTHTLDCLAFLDEQLAHNGVVTTDGYDTGGVVDEEEHVADVAAIVEVGAESGVGPGGELGAVGGCGW